MKILGIIVEYNPFHTGHLYHLQKAKEMVKPDLTIAIMSGMKRVIFNNDS